MLQTLPVLLYAGAYLLLFITWALVVCFHVPGADNLVQYIQLTLSALTGHVLTLIDPNSRPPGPSAPAVVTPPLNPQAGCAMPSMMLTLVCLVAVAMLSACSLMPANFGHVEEGAAQAVVQSSERAICRDIPIGTWMRLYGTSADRVKGWQSLCFNPVTAPLNDDTVAAILKVYPKFQQAVAAGTPLPAASVIPPLSSDASVPN